MALLGYPGRPHWETQTYSRGKWREGSLQGQEGWASGSGSWLSEGLYEMFQDYVADWIFCQSGSHILFCLQLISLRQPLWPLECSIFSFKEGNWKISPPMLGRVKSVCNSCMDVSQWDHWCPLSCSPPFTGSNIINKNYSLKFEPAFLSDMSQCPHPWYSVVATSPTNPWNHQGKQPWLFPLSYAQLLLS